MYVYTSNSKNCCPRRIRQFFISFHFQCVACEECLIHRGFPVWAASLLLGVLPPGPRFTFTLAISGHWLPPQTLALPVESKQAMWALWPQEILAFLSGLFNLCPYSYIKMGPAGARMGFSFSLWRHQWQPFSYPLIPFEGRSEPGTSCAK